MALKMDTVRELATSVARLATEVAHLHGRVFRLLKHNAAKNVAWQAATKTFTAANATDLLTATAHGLLAGQKCRLTNSGGALPAGLAANTDYWLVTVTANTFQLATTKGGAPVNFTSDGTGTHTLWPVADYVTLDDDLNLSSFHATGQQVSDAIGSLMQFDNLMQNAAVTQGNHLANLNQLASPLGQ